jgi:UDP-3-O-[3-hydroxymyristoyl] N-acetylglucosamine deacetylase/3-hydroxyacyl-[acyl-carrier-protein] dehydratase
MSTEKQITIARAVSVSGVGLHTGAPVTMTYCPAPENTGYKFKRIDLPGQPVVDADVDNVVDVSRGTSIAQHGARINTVEHALAALAGLEIDNCIIELDGPETPIMDGSSIKFIETNYCQKNVV